MRQALRAVREQLGEDAVILSSRKTGDGVEVTAAVDFDAATLEGSGFANAPEPLPPPRIIDATPVPVETAAAARRAPASRNTLDSSDARSPDSFAVALRTPAASNTASTRAGHSNAAQSASDPRSQPALSAPTTRSPAASSAATARPVSTQSATRASSGLNATAIALTTGRAPAPAPVAAPARIAVPNKSYHELSAVDQPEDYDDGVTFTSQAARYAAYEADMISEAAREAVVEHMAGDRAPVLEAAPSVATAPTTAARAAAKHSRPELDDASERTVAKRTSYEDIAEDEHGSGATDPVAEIREATLTPLASNEVKAAFAEFKANVSAVPASDAMSDELKTLRRMLENQLAHLAWNDLTRRAPVHTEILRELTEIGISHDLAEHLVRQLPEDQDLTFARRFTIAGLSQYLKVTGDRWLDDGGRVAFVGATGVGKTTTLAKIAVRWVLRHGARDLALVAADPVRIGAHDQLRSLAQLLGVPVYTPDSFDQLPALLSRLSERLILIDTPGSSARDTQLAGRLAVLSTSASKLETALVLAASTQAGSIEETVRRFAPANPACCVLTKLDEAASLGGVLSALIRARMPVSYMSEGQRVPEDLRPARALELVSAAVRLAKARGAAADEDLLRRRFGKNAHGIS